MNDEWATTTDSLIQNHGNTVGYAAHPETAGEVDARRLLQELQILQTELEAQNRELQETARN